MIKTPSQVVDPKFNVLETKEKKLVRKLCVGNFVMFCDLLILFFSILIVFGQNNQIDILPLIGKFIIGLSIYMLLKLKSNKKIAFLFAVICFINISLGVSDLINKGSYVAEWQLPLRYSEYNISTAKSVLLFLSILNVILDYTWIKNKVANISFNEFQRKNNPIISYVGIGILFIILLTGYSSEVRTTEGYVSNNNPMYEYAIVIYLIVWIFSGRNKIAHILLFIYSACYSLYSLNFGDRSAAFLMLVLLFMLYFEKKISVIKLLILAIVAVFIANFIAVVRSDVPLDFATTIEKTQDRGLYSDTVSYSYYAGISISALHHVDTQAPTYFVSYLKSLLLGSRSTEYGNLATYATTNYNALFNRGGGFYFTSFYAWFGYIGVILSAVILGFILRAVYSRRGSFALLYQLLIIVFCMRWYLYNPTVLFRSVFIVSTVAYFICLTFDRVITKKVEKEGSVKKPRLAMEKRYTTS